MNRQLGSPPRGRLHHRMVSLSVVGKIFCHMKYVFTVQIHEVIQFPEKRLRKCCSASETSTRQPSVDTYFTDRGPCRFPSIEAMFPTIKMLVMLHSHAPRMILFLRSFKSFNSSNSRTNIFSDFPSCCPDSREHSLEFSDHSASTLTHN